MVPNIFSLEEAPRIARWERRTTVVVSGPHIQVFFHEDPSTTVLQWLKDQGFIPMRIRNRQAYVYRVPEFW